MSVVERHAELLAGSIVLNDAVGGINPAAVEVALRSGGMWVGFPTVSSRAFQARLGQASPRMQVPLGIGARELSVLGADGALRPEALTTLDLAAAANAVVHLGYLTFAETLSSRAPPRTPASRGR